MSLGTQGLGLGSSTGGGTAATTTNSKSPFRSSYAVFRVAPAAAQPPGAPPATPTGPAASPLNKESKVGLLLDLGDDTSTPSSPSSSSSAPTPTPTPTTASSISTDSTTTITTSTSGGATAQPPVLPAAVAPTTTATTATATTTTPEGGTVASQPQPPQIIAASVVVVSGSGSGSGSAAPPTTPGRATSPPAALGLGSASLNNTGGLLLSSPSSSSSAMLNSPSKITWTVVNCVACQLPSPSMQGTLQHTVEARLAKKAVLKTGSLELVMLSPPSAPPPSPITTPILSLSTASPQQSPSLPSAPPTVTASISTAALTSVPSSPRLASGSTTVCYMTLVECSGGCFVLCLLPPNGTTQQDMEKFRRELGSYCCEAVALKLLDDEGRLPQLKQYFSDWWIRCVLYLARCVEELSGHLAAFLYAVLFGKQLKFASEIPVDAVDDFERFLETISLVGRVQSETSAAIPATTTPSLIDDNSSSIQLGIASHTTTIMDETSPYTLSVTETNPFCQQWAVQMHLNKSSPIALQDLIEKMKMDVITELNQARKLIDQARHTHHALYKAYYHISNAELCEILLGLLAKAHVSELSNPGFSEVVEIICSHHYSKKSISNPALNSVLSTTSSSTASSTNTTPVVVPHKNTAAGGFGLQRVRMVPLL